MGSAAGTLVDQVAVPITRIPCPQRKHVGDIVILPSAGEEEPGEPPLGITRGTEVILWRDGQEGGKLPLDESRLCHGYAKAGLCLG
jgi:hypothetical protein